MWKELVEETGERETWMNGTVGLINPQKEEKTPKKIYVEDQKLIEETTEA